MAEKHAPRLEDVCIPAESSTAGQQHISETTSALDTKDIQALKEQTTERMDTIAHLLRELDLFELLKHFNNLRRTVASDPKIQKTLPWLLSFLDEFRVYKRIDRGSLVIFINKSFPQVLETYSGCPITSKLDLDLSSLSSTRPQASPGLVVNAYFDIFNVLPDFLFSLSRCTVQSESSGTWVYYDEADFRQAVEQRGHLRELGNFGRAPRAAIAALPRVPVGGSMLDESGKAECVICKSDVKEGDLVTKLGCGHWFDTKCIEVWLRQCGDCCYCRQHILKTMPRSISWKR